MLIRRQLSTSSPDPKRSGEHICGRRARATQTHTCIHTRKHTRTQTYTYTHTHTHTLGYVTSPRISSTTFDALRNQLRNEVSKDKTLVLPQTKTRNNLPTTQIRLTSHAEWPHPPLEALHPTPQTNAARIATPFRRGRGNSTRIGFTC